MRFAGILEPGVASGLITYAKYIQGGYIVVNTIQERDALAAGITVEGTPVYVVSENREYRKSGEGWEVQPSPSEILTTSASVAGVTFDNDKSISVEELSDALNLQSLAHKDTAEGTVNDYADNITGVSYTPSGINNSSEVTINTNSQVAASFSEGAFTPASITYSSSTFAKEGIVAAIDSEDTSCLVIRQASTDTASAITAFNGGSKAADTFNAKTVITDITSATAAGQTFIGTQATITPILNKTTKTIIVN